MLICWRVDCRHTKCTDDIQQTSTSMECKPHVQAYVYPKHCLQICNCLKVGCWRSLDRICSLMGVLPGLFLVFGPAWPRETRWKPLPTSKIICRGSSQVDRIGKIHETNRRHWGQVSNFILTFPNLDLFWQFHCNYWDDFYNLWHLPFITIYCITISVPLL